MTDWKIRQIESQPWKDQHTDNAPIPDSTVTKKPSRVTFSCQQHPQTNRASDFLLTFTLQAPPGSLGELVQSAAQRKKRIKRHRWAEEVTLPVTGVTVMTILDNFSSQQTNSSLLLKTNLFLYINLYNKNQPVQCFTARKYSTECTILLVL